MKIRDAKVEDASLVAEILNPVIRETTISFKTEEFSLKAVEELIEGAPVFLVAVSGNNILGFSYYDQFRKASGYARSLEISVMLSPNARGMGVGRQLVSALESRAKASGAGSLWGAVSAENQAAIEFHKALGFENVATLPKVGFKFDRWLDLVLMQKWLAEEGDVAETSD